MFFFKALLQGDHLPLAKEKVDYVWVSKEELADYLRPEYHSQVTRFVVDLWTIELDPSPIASVWQGAYVGEDAYLVGFGNQNSAE